MLILRCLFLIVGIFAVSECSRKNITGCSIDMLFDHQSNDLDSTFYITCNATCLTDIDNACIFVQ